MNNQNVYINKVRGIFGLLLLLVISTTLFAKGYSLPVPVDLTRASEMNDFDRGSNDLAFMLVVNAGPDQTICTSPSPNNPDVALTASVTGGVDPITYIWENGAGADTAVSPTCEGGATKTVRTSDPNTNSWKN